MYYYLDHNKPLKHKKLRNVINCGIRKETIAQNEKRVQSAKSDSKNYFPVYR